jgi:hypothetical protein
MAQSAPFSTDRRCGRNAERWTLTANGEWHFSTDFLKSLKPSERMDYSREVIGRAMVRLDVRFQPRFPPRLWREPPPMFAPRRCGRFDEEDIFLD